MTDTYDPTKMPIEVGQHVRQGDVLLIRRSRLGPGAVELPREKGAVVLAHGEVTGHMHQLRGPQVTMFRDTSGHEYVRVTHQPEALVHEEHTAHGIPPGPFELGAQVEYTPGPLQLVAD
ncbi:MAG: hypothetical protein P4L73_20650 [Caulobacteraceae bacterium]|nr:hypothetical protein [Caulobacteraceae bacterium]